MSDDHDTRDWTSVVGLELLANPDNEGTGEHELSTRYITTTDINHGQGRRQQYRLADECRIPSEILEFFGNDTDANWFPVALTWDAWGRVRRIEVTDD